jgi:hypothetical protein
MAITTTLTGMGLGWPRAVAVQMISESVERIHGRKVMDAMLNENKLWTDKDRSGTN